MGGMEATPNTDPYIVEKISRHLSLSPNHIVAIENVLVRPGDPGIKVAKSRVRIIDGYIYHVLLSQDSMVDIQYAVKKSRGSIPSIGFLSSLGDTDLAAIQNSFELPSRLADVLASSLLSLFVRAYDWEGYLVWDRGRKN